VYSWLRSILFLLPAEVAHTVAFVGLRWLFAVPWLSRWLRAWLGPRDPALEVSALGLTFASPLGLAAGFDKNATGYEALGALGFGFIEVGTVTALPQPGNPKPRLFRLPKDHALINRMGFNNAGAEAMSQRLLARRTTIVGVNLGKSKVTPEEQAASDYESSARALVEHADYLVVNVSSPNTPGLRNLQSVEKLRPILTAVQTVIGGSQRKPQLLVKIAPDLDDADVDAVADLAMELGLHGIIATNTTIARSGLTTAMAEVTALGAGGLSGPVLKRRALEVLRRVKRRVGNRLHVIAVGGIENADDVWERLVAGATLVQVYTGFIYGGPLFAYRINREIGRRVRAAGLTSLRELNGVAE
jgi:dihydroorotate dehydrogenase